MSRSENQWNCSSCDTDNRASALICKKCRTSRKHARMWECQQCHCANLGAVYQCTRCKYDRNGLTKTVPVKNELPEAVLSSGNVVNGQ